MEEKIIYLSLPPSALVKKTEVCVEDIGTVFCSDPEIRFQVEKTKLFTFEEKGREQAVLTVLAVIQKISEQYKDCPVQSMGSSETVVYYKEADKENQGLNLRTILLFLLAFFGTGYSIMSYNGDVGAIDLLQNLHTLFTGKIASTAGNTLGIAAYCVGLFIGMLVFFNHGINHKLTDDPTPLQVQMRLYERDVNDTITIDSERKGQTIDVD